MAEMLPVYQIKGKQYFRDVRLGEYRNVKDFSDTIPINSFPELQKPTLPHPFSEMKRMKEVDWSVWDDAVVKIRRDCGYHNEPMDGDETAFVALPPEPEFVM